MTLPTGWRATKVRELAIDEPNAFVDGPFGSNLKSSHYTQSGPRVLRLENIGDGVFRDVRTHIAEEHFRTLLRHEARCGDIVMALLGDEIPRAVVVPARVGPAIVKADCPRLRVDPKVADPAFVAHALNAPQTRSRAKALVHGVGRPRLNLREARELSVPLAPLAEQRRIVEALETQLTRLDAAIATLKRVSANLRRYRASVLQAAVEGRLGSGGGAVGWRRASVAELAWDSGYGTSVKCAADGSGLPVLRIPNVAGGRIDLGDMKYAAGDLAVEPKETVRTGDLLIVRTNGSRSLIGRAAYVAHPLSRPTHFASYLIRLRLRTPEVTGPWLGVLWHSPQMRRVIEAAAATSAGQYNLSLRSILSFQVPVPPSSAIPQIVAAVDEHVSLADAELAVVEGSLGRILRVRQAILRTAFEGRLVPQDPNEEPADALLVRIRAEREAVPAAERPRRRSTRTRRGARA